MGKSKNKKGKRKSQGTKSVQENLLPPVLTKEVDVDLDLAPPIRDELDSDESSPPPSPTGSVCSTTSSLLSIGPPPYVQPPKNVGKKPKGSIVASVSKYHDSFQSIAAGGLQIQPKKKSQGSKVPKAVTPKEETPSTSTGRPGPAITKELVLDDLIIASSVPDTGSIDSHVADLPISPSKVGPAKKKVRGDAAVPPRVSSNPGPSKEAEVPLVDLTNDSPTVPVVDLTMTSSSASGDDTTNELLSVFEIDDESEAEEGEAEEGEAEEGEAEEGEAGSSELALPMEEAMSPESIFGATLDSPGFVELEELPEASELGDTDFMNMTDDLISTAIASSSSGGDSEVLEYMFMQYDLADYPAISRCIEAEGKEEVTVPSDCSSGQVPGGLSHADTEHNEPTSAGIENLQHLQTELESLRSCMITRINMLTEEREQYCQPTKSPHDQNNACATIAKANEAKDVTDTPPEPVAGPSTAIAGPPPAVVGTSKSFEKQSKPKPARGRGPSHQRKANAKSNGRKNNSSTNSDPQKDSPQFAYNDFDTVSDNFWRFMEFYVPTVKQEDLDRLDSLVTEHENIPASVLHIPPLGKHYKDRNNTGVKTRQHTQQAGPTKDPVGPLTERLIKTLVNERVQTYQNTRARTKAATLGAANQVEEPNPLIQQQQNLAKDLGLNGMGADGNQRQPLEEKLRNVMSKYRFMFQSHGARSGAGPSNNDPQDEVLTEIHRTQGEFRRLHAQNAQTFVNLRARAVKELELNVLRDQLKLADQRIWNIYKAQQLRPNKKLPVKLKNEALDALRNRSNLIQLIDDKQSEGPQANVKVAGLYREEQPQPTASKETADAP